jgi:hypothetical protein
MPDPSIIIPLAGSAAAGLALASAASLKAWAQWLDLRREALRFGRPASPAPPDELKALRERVRKLEAIADGAAG